MKYTDSHEWIILETAELARIGVTNYAQKELGDIVYVELPSVGKTVNAGQEVVVLESTKAAADVYSPVSGEIVEINPNLSSQPELINQSPEQNGWLLKVRLSNPSELDLLMDQTTYQAMLNGA
ncbi:Glycine cleavage system H protein [Candidatus Protochlamydia naegleriophila]|uniref:Glycine cleavage system H protein n=1 Tax=Candidatus Protochlamydia naegleriophila TaxID=389348 RepID=A0A0U5JI15_9BACT|nr:glycine cleavage system protein GcvH [Candidatus Protochlamydia naegleriophila]CUI17637.1 Glycine cleavage system H protein [Candidatus Protochlamydia naegleriophila]